MKRHGLRKWEMALALTVCVTLCHGLAFGGAAAANWWGVIFPGLTDGLGFRAETVETAALAGTEGIQLRLQLLEWLRVLIHQ